MSLLFLSTWKNEIETLVEDSCEGELELGEVAFTCMRLDTFADTNQYSVMAHSVLRTTPLFFVCVIPQFCTDA